MDDSLGFMGGMGGMFLGVDPLYWIMTGIGMVISMAAQWWIKSAYAKYSRIGNSRNLSGAEAAAEMLRDEGVTDVKIQQYQGGMLSDHYDPRTKTINLSPDVFQGRSLASVGVACHEAGYALQHAKGYKYLALRSLLVGPTTFASKLAIPLLMGGLLLNMLGLAKFGLILFGVTFLFQVITLPVEINASMRSKASLVAHHVVAPGRESQGVSTMLSAAAFTYIAAAIASLMNLLYWAFKLGLIGGNRRNE